MDKIPQHIAVILDGNRRWAKRNRLKNLIKGHEEGLKRVEELIDYNIEYGVKYLSVYAFSQENWARPDEEVKGIMKLLGRACDKFKSHLDKGVKIKFIGDKGGKLSDKIIKKMNKIESLSEEIQEPKLHFLPAINYSGFNDIVNAVNKVIKDGSKEITKETIDKNISTADYPNPDLLIRTSGEKRISNFMIWQLAYTELYLPDILWPDFKRPDFEKALKEYARRTRRFGK